MTGAWFQELAKDYKLSVECVEQLYQQAQTNRYRTTYSYFIELLEEEVSRRDR